MDVVQLWRLVARRENASVEAIMDPTLFVGGARGSQAYPREISSLPTLFWCFKSSEGSWCVGSLCHYLTVVNEGRVRLV